MSKEYILKGDYLQILNDIQQETYNKWLVDMDNKELMKKYMQVEMLKRKQQ